MIRVVWGDFVYEEWDVVKEVWCLWVEDRRCGVEEKVWEVLDDDVGGKGVFWVLVLRGKGVGEE